jgi:Fe-S cluster assembly protein SufD
MTEIQGHLEEVFISDFELNKNTILKSATPFVRQARIDALETMKSVTIPSNKTELYKFTNIRGLLSDSGRLVHNYNIPSIVSPLEEFFRCEIHELDTYDLVLVDGYYPKGIPLFQRLDGGAVVGSLKEAMEVYPEIIDKHYSKYSDAHSDGMIAFNTAFATDGIFTYFPANTGISKPIQIVTLVNKNENLLFQPIIQYRNLIVIEKNSQIKIVFCDHTMSNERSISNSVTEIFVGENANVEVYRVQNQHNKAAQVSDFHIHQESNSNFSMNTLTLNGGFVRNNVNVQVNGENCTTNLYGLYLVDRQQHVDNNTCINHLKPNSRSEELYKGILDDQARGVFRGKIEVSRDAQKTASYQKNNNLLLTDEATMNTMPQLEIYADDVKCSHGATVGYLDAEALFYLRSRGISEKESRLLLMNAFASEIIKKISIESLRDRLSQLVYKRLRGELSPCATCVLKCND